MKKLIFSIIPVFFLVAVFSSNAIACDKGCTPGFWKQTHHFDQWVSYSPGDYLDDIFGCGNHITLLAALKSRGGGINALQRHAVASLLNADVFPCFDGGNPQDIIDAFCDAVDGDSYDIMEQKDEFEDWNEQRCPLN